MIQKNFAEVIKKAITESGLSLRAFAKQCSIDSSYLSKVLKGKRNPPAEEAAIAKIAEFIGMPTERLMFICGRIPSRLQKIFLREDIFEILEELPQEKSRVQNRTNLRSAKRPVYKRQDIPDEIL
ncbi:MAG: helix-turn-helix transcriptional regulator [Elusimicrobia bacterium]|nr:helix-turn-helix transcriptional regulator [Elusimicrobiota bacterium]